MFQSTHITGEEPEKQQQQQQEGKNSTNTTKTLFSLQERSRELLASNSPWMTQDYYDEALSIMTGLSHRHSRKDALLVERIIRRVVQEQSITTTTAMGGGDHMEQEQKHQHDNNNISVHISNNNSNAIQVDMTAMYTCAIRAWSNSQERGAAAGRAEEILDTMQQHYNVDGIAEIKPGVEAFNLVLLAHARTGLPDAPQQCLRVLTKLHDWFTSGKTNVASNKQSYATVLWAFAKTGKPDAPAHVKRLLEHFERLAQEEGYASVRPDYLCHGAYVTALIDAMERDHITGEEAANEAERYLMELRSSPYEDARPDYWYFRTVLYAWSQSYCQDMVPRAEALMKLLEDYHEQSGRSARTRPATKFYNMMVACYARSNLPDKGDKARQILRKMQALVASGNNTAARPDVVTYNTGKEQQSPCMTLSLLLSLLIPFFVFNLFGQFYSVMNAYGKSKDENAPYEAEALLRELHQAYEESGDPRLRPNSRSFNTCVSSPP